MIDKNAFCKGILCRKTDRKFKSFISGKKICGSCSIRLDKKHYCTIDELIVYDNPIIRKYFKELFEDGKEQELKTEHKLKAVVKA